LGRCGLLLGIPERKDDTSSTSRGRGSNWTTPLFACGSANRAVIKSVDFKFNSSLGLKGLTVRNIKPKEYASPTEFPLWATQSILVLGRFLGTVDYIWGIVEREDPSFPNMTYKRAPELWLGGLNRGFSTLNQNLPASDVPPAVLEAVYMASILTDRTIADYSGYNNQLLYGLWRNLSTSTRGVSRVVNLIWTDIAANAMMGTRGWVPSPTPPGLVSKRDHASGEEDAEARVPIRLFTRIVKYRIPYAIPAILVLAILAMGLILIVLLLLGGRTTTSKLAWFISRLTSGRIMTRFLENGEDGDEKIEESASSTTSAWVSGLGRMQVDISGSVPRKSHTVESDADDSMDSGRQEQQPLQRD